MRPIPGAATAPTWPPGPATTIPTIPADQTSLWAHVAARTPVVLLLEDGNSVPNLAAGATSHHLFHHNLTPAALAAAAGDLPVTVETRKKGASFGQGTKTVLPFGQALARLATDHSLYLSAQAPPKPAPGNLPLPLGDLALSLTEPSPGAPTGLIPIRHPLAGALIPAAVNLWLGGAAAASGLHADVHDNLLSIVAGVKEVTLFPPAVVGDLATVGRPVRVWPNGRLVFAGPDGGAGPDGASEAGLREAAARAAQREARVAVVDGDTDEEEEAALEAALEAGGGLDDYEEDEEMEGEEQTATPSHPPTFSRADLAHPAAVRAAFPGFPWSSGRTVTLTPGQALYIPAGWFHFVESKPGTVTGPSPWSGLHAAVNHWFHPPDAARGGEGGGAEHPYSRPYWAGVWEEALEACPRLKRAVEAQGVVKAPVQQPQTATDSFTAAMALMKQGLTGLDSFEAGGRGALRRERRLALLKALSGRRTRHGAGCVLPWVVRKRRRA